MHWPKALILSLVVLMIPALAVANTFVDDNNSVHEPDVEAIAAAGITKGCSPQGDRFCPKQPVRRGEMAAFLVRALELPPTDVDYFADDAGHQFEDDINRIAAAGITNGCQSEPNASFCPNGNVSRGAMAAFLSRALTLPSASGDRFIDDNGNPFEDAIQEIAAANITKGCNSQGNRFCPHGATTRAQMASFLTRALKLPIPSGSTTGSGGRAQPGATTPPGGTVPPGTTTPPPPGPVEGEITGNACPCAVSSTVELKGEVHLRGDLMVNGGTLVARPGVRVHGNGHQIMVMNGGVLDWRGTPKSGWVEWGNSVSGWRSGDRLAVAPLAKGDYSIHSDTWTGSWNDVSPSKSVLSDGTQVKAEVANLDRDIVIDNVSRIMFHMGAGVQTIKYVAVRNSGVDAELGFYPLHFHLNHETVRGSLVEGVVVENGDNHAFVPHGSNGVVFRDVAAVKTRNTAFWWDKPSGGDTSNNSDDTVWQHALALGVTKPSDDGGKRLSAFQLGAGIDNTCIECHAAGVRGSSDSVSGFIWPEFTGGGQNEEGVWNFTDSVAHNNEESGIFVWQNVTRPHTVENTLLYRNGEHGINHGAYSNTYTYRNVRSIDNEQGGMIHAVGKSDIPLRFIEVESSSRWVIGRHRRDNSPVEYVRVQFNGGVVFAEDASDEPSDNRFRDSGLTPADFDFHEIHPDTVISIYENDVLVHRWEDGSWD